jgi:hypothetical protein
MFANSETLHAELLLTFLNVTLAAPAFVVPTAHLRERPLDYHADPLLHHVREHDLGEDQGAEFRKASVFPQLSGFAPSGRASRG